MLNKQTALVFYYFSTTQHQSHSNLSDTCRQRGNMHSYFLFHYKEQHKPENQRVSVFTLGKVQGVQSPDKKRNITLFSYITQASGRTNRHNDLISNIIMAQNVLTVLLTVNKGTSHCTLKTSALKITQFLLVFTHLYVQTGTIQLTF